MVKSSVSIPGIMVSSSGESQENEFIITIIYQVHRTLKNITEFGEDRSPELFIKIVNTFI